MIGRRGGTVVLSSLKTCFFGFCLPAKKTKRWVLAMREVLERLDAIIEELERLEEKKGKTTNEEVWKKNEGKR